MRSSEKPYVVTQSRILSPMVLRPNLREQSHGQVPSLSRIWILSELEHGRILADQGWKDFENYVSAPHDTGEFETEGQRLTDFLTNLLGLPPPPTTKATLIFPINPLRFSCSWMHLQSGQRIEVHVPLYSSYTVPMGILSENPSQPRAPGATN